MWEKDIIYKMAGFENIIKHEPNQILTYENYINTKGQLIENRDRIRVEKAKLKAELCSIL